MNNSDAAVTSSTIYTKSAARSPSTLVEADQQPMEQKTKSLESLTSTIVPNDDLGGQAVADPPLQAPSTIELPVVIADKSKASFYDDAWLSLRLDLNGFCLVFCQD